MDSVFFSNCIQLSPYSVPHRYPSRYCKPWWAIAFHLTRSRSPILGASSSQTLRSHPTCSHDQSSFANRSVGYGTWQYRRHPTAARSHERSLVDRTIYLPVPQAHEMVTYSDRGQLAPAIRPTQASESLHLKHTCLQSSFSCCSWTTCAWTALATLRFIRTSPPSSGMTT